VRLFVEAPLGALPPSGACGDVVSARASAETLLGQHGLGTPVRTMARTLLTAAILELTSRLDPRPTLSDLSLFLAEAGGDSARPFANSPMQFLQFVDCEWRDLTAPYRQQAVDLCRHALSSVQTDITENP
jgi:hypothetical protein